MVKKKKERTFWRVLKFHNLNQDNRFRQYFRMTVVEFKATLHDTLLDQLVTLTHTNTVGAKIAVICKHRGIVTLIDIQK